MVADDGNVRQQVVRPGPRIDGYRVIRQGLTGEESVVVAGIQRIRPGVKIAPQPTTLPPERRPPGNGGNGGQSSATASGAAP